MDTHHLELALTPKNCNIPTRTFGSPCPCRGNTYALYFLDNTNSLWHFHFPYSTTIITSYTSVRVSNYFQNTIYCNLDFSYTSLKTHINTYITPQRINCCQFFYHFLQEEPSKGKPGSNLHYYQPTHILSYSLELHKNLPSYFTK